MAVALQGCIRPGSCLDSSRAPEVCIRAPKAAEPARKAAPEEEAPTAGNTAVESRASAQEPLAGLWGCWAVATLAAAQEQTALARVAVASAPVPPALARVLSAGAVVPPSGSCRQWPWPGCSSPAVRPARELIKRASSLAKECALSYDPLFPGLDLPVLLPDMKAHVQCASFPPVNHNSIFIHSACHSARNGNPRPAAQTHPSSHPSGKRFCAPADIPAAARSKQPGLESLTCVVKNTGTGSKFRSHVSLLDSHPRRATITPKEEIDVHP